MVATLRKAHNKDTCTDRKARAGAVY